jgi:Kef-type K+ transport system membrane component KefB
MLVAAARSFLPQETSLVGSGAALAFGFVLLAALQTGVLFSGVKLPRLTGYLICGFVVGPSVLNYVTDRMVSDLKLGFAGVNGLATATFRTSGPQGLVPLLVHLFGSMGVGVALGAGFAVYVKKVATRLALFVFGVCFFAAEAGVRLHLDPLLMCLTAGLFVENVTDVEGSQLIHGIEAASTPVFALFFALAGAGLHWDAFRSVAAFALLFAGVRAVGMQLGSRAGMALGNVPAEHRKFIPFGMLSQSGVTIGLSILIGRQYPGWGEGARACLLGTVMVHEIVGPILLRSALVRSGEAGRKAPVIVAH